MTKVIVLRPEPGASETVDRAKARGLDAVAIPLFAIESLEWSAPEPAGFDALLLTSANALRFGGEQLGNLRGLPVHAVGKATAEAARDAGFDIASSGDAGIERLLGSLEADLKLLHLCGEDRTEAEARQEITAVPVYRSRMIEPAPDVGAAQGQIVLVHSQRATRRLAELVSQRQVDRTEITVIAISEAAGAAAGTGWKRIATVDQPTDDALLALVERLCDNGAQG